MSNGTVCRDMIRGGSNGLRAHFTRATISAYRLLQRGADQPLAPVEHCSFGAADLSVAIREKPGARHKVHF
jgi:hypothetical protein